MPETPKENNYMLVNEFANRLSNENGDINKELAAKANDFLVGINDLVNSDGCIESYEASGLISEIEVAIKRLLNMEDPDEQAYEMSKFKLQIATYLHSFRTRCDDCVNLNSCSDSNATE